MGFIGKDIKINFALILPQLTYLNKLSHHVDPMVFPLLFPLGDLRWSTGYNKHPNAKKKCFNEKTKYLNEKNKYPDKKNKCPNKKEKHDKMG